MGGYMLEKTRISYICAPIAVLKTYSGKYDGM